MDKMPLIALIFQSIPESILILALGLTLMGVELKWKRIFPAALISSLASYFVRELPIPYGIHTLIGICVLTLLVIIFFRTSFSVAISAAMIGIAILASVEMLILPVIFSLIGERTINKIWSSPALRVLLAIPELVVLGVLTFWCIKKKINLRSLSNNHAKKSERD
ncbi:MAG: hypothetical protein PWP72_19 [Thermoanaerobacter sp.]|jgi:hypothetical protein|nr:hypothetical protein [Thermoanaerobacter sp.]